VNKHLVNLLAIAAILTTVFVFNPVSAERVSAGACVILDTTHNDSLVHFVDVPVGHSITATFYKLDGTQIGTITVVATSTPAGYSSTITPYRIVIIDNDCNRCSFTDGRLNCNDAGQTAAIYCKPDGSVEVLAIFEGKGYPAFTASPAEIASVPAKPAKNTLIKQGNGAFLYRLTSGQLQVNRREDGTPAKDYSFRFNDCAKP
jgi:hypothetical protein